MIPSPFAAMIASDRPERIASATTPEMFTIVSPFTTMLDSTAIKPVQQLRQLDDVQGNRPSLTTRVKTKGPWRNLGDCCQEPRSVCVRGAELLPCALADKNAWGYRLRTMGANSYPSQNPLAALLLRPLG